jgi:exopolysaccharide biosynthesis protein
VRTDGRHPRAALGIGDGSVIAVACDGRRTGVDAGLSMLELAQVMRELGVESAINLDGGGSTTLVHRGHLEPAVLVAGSAGAGVAPDRQRTGVRMTRAA